MLGLVLLSAAVPAAAQQRGAGHGTAGWIGYPGEPGGTRLVVLHLRHTVGLKANPARYPVRISADTNFVLWVKGRRVAAGQSPRLCRPPHLRPALPGWQVRAGNYPVVVGSYAGDAKLRGRAILGEITVTP